MLNRHFFYLLTYFGSFSWHRIGASFMWLLMHEKNKHEIDDVLLPLNFSKLS